MRFRTVAALTAPLAVAGCVSANVTYLGPRQNFAPVAEDSVRVFLEKGKWDVPWYWIER